MGNMLLPATVLVGSLLSTLPGCGDDATVDAGDAGLDSRVDGTIDAGLCAPPSYPPDPGECAPSDDDYAPGNGAYAPCVSDEGRYVPIEATISSIGRVRAFEEIAALLFDPEAPPSAEDFIAARQIYQEDEGLDSRVVRRYDPHFDPPADGDCTMDGVPERAPDYCVGPAQLQPEILGALNAGIAGEDPSANAGRTLGALLWFLYASTYKESLTCTNTAKDCDSAVAYYNGGEPLRCGIGLSRYVAEVDAYAHDRAIDGALALRCWRDLDDGEVAADLPLRDRARAQYDRATLDGVAAIVKGRLLAALAATEAGDGAAQSFHWAAAQVLGRALEREMLERSPADGARLRDELLHENAAAADVEAATAAIDAAFECP